VPRLILRSTIILLRVVSCLAETNRTPFSFSEGESELVSGFNVEYGIGGGVWFNFFCRIRYNFLFKYTKGVPRSRVITLKFNKIYYYCSISIFLNLSPVDIAPISVRPINKSSLKENFTNHLREIRAFSHINLLIN